ncbi:hypothetical protein ACIQKB_25600 [Streptomyces sp. NPDC092046]|uniref:hypothetical protein n=1 Tax=Streptomyces sp. NPDC092046 TaxID=3366009 RepID=UPI003813D4D4
MHRRAFLTAASVAAAGTVTLSGVAPPVGSGDILRLGRQLDTVNALDAQRAGHDRVECRARRGGAALPGRMRSLLGDFHSDLIRPAPGSATAPDWADRYRAEWSRP